MIRSLSHLIIEPQLLVGAPHLPLEGFPGGDATEAAWSWYLLAKAFEDGTPLPKDIALAFRLYRRSTQAGLPLAHICTGFAYRTGTGTPVDEAERKCISAPPVSGVQSLPQGSPCSARAYRFVGRAQVFRNTILSWGHNTYDNNANFKVRVRWNCELCESGSSNP